MKILINIIAIVILQVNVFAQESKIANDSISISELKDSQDPVIIKTDRKHFKVPYTTKRVSLNFIGYAKLIAGVDFGNIQNTSEFYPSKIPIYPTLQEQQPHTFLDARQTRLGVDAVYNVQDQKKLHIYVEIDFYNTETQTSLVPHLRHAYGEYNGFLLGQTWSTMKNNSAFPVQVDFEGPNSIPGPRNPMIRYTKKYNKGFSFATAIETHKEDYTPYSIYPDDVNSYLIAPDFIAYIQQEGKWGNVRLNGIISNFSYTNKDTITTKIEYDYGWGIEISGILKFFNRDNINDDIRFVYLYGKGISYYINDLRGMGLGAAPDKYGNMTVISEMGGYIAYKHAWNKKSTSSAIFSFTKIDNSVFNNNQMLNYSTYAAVNYMWTPLDRLDFGIEFIYGRNVNKIEDYGEGYRFQAMSIFHF